MLWDISHTCSSVSVRSYTYISLLPNVLTHKPFACSSDHNYRTTSRQLQATELFKLSRLVVVLRFFSGVRSGKRQCRVYLAVCTSCTNPVHVAATRTAGKQLQLHSSSCNTPVIICVPRLVYTCGPAEPACSTYVTCCTNPVHATGALHYACRRRDTRTMCWR
jgi:hypothetical protein